MHAPPVLPSLQSAPDARQAPFWYIYGAMKAIVSTAVLIAYIPKRWQFHNGRGGWNPTLTFFNIVYILFVLDGVAYLFYGAWRISVLAFPAESPGIIMNGAFNIAPFLGALLYGRPKLFKVMEKRFEDKRRKIDSAVIAQLMDSTRIQVGIERWIQHKLNLVDEFIDKFDHRVNWYRGTIVEIEIDRFTVDVNVEQLPLDIRKQKNNVGVVKEQGRRRGLAATNKIVPQAAARPLVRVLLPKSDKLTAEKLLKNAMDKLRLVDGQYVTQGLMAK